MSNAATFSNPVLVQEGVAFCVALPGRKKAVVIATAASLQPGTGQTLMEAFHGASIRLHETACHLLLQGASSPVFIEPHHLLRSMVLPPANLRTFDMAAA